MVAVVHRYMSLLVSVGYRPNGPLAVYQGLLPVYGGVRGGYSGLKSVLTGLYQSVIVLYRYSYRSAINMAYYDINLRGPDRSGSVKDVFLSVYYRSYVS